jgi:ribosomal protein S18 acetylase RimI-like enzyme
MDIVIRRASSDDWATLRAVRLAALTDSPTAFGSTYAREEALTEPEWRDWLDRASGANGAMFLAFDGEECVGVVGAYDHEGTSVRLVSMWVAPAARGSGLGQRLVNQVITWARSIGRDVVDLHVTIGNAAAERLYRRMGFQPTDDTQPLPSDPSYTLRRMELPLAD